MLFRSPYDHVYLNVVRLPTVELGNVLSAKVDYRLDVVRGVNSAMPFDLWDAVYQSGNLNTPRLTDVDRGIRHAIGAAGPEWVNRW